MTQTSPIAAIEVFGNPSTPTATILQAFGKQPGALWDFSEYKLIADRVIAACGLRDLMISASHYPPNEGVFVTLDVVEADAAVWQWRSAPTEELPLPAEIMQAVEQRRESFGRIKFARGFTMRRADGGRMRTDQGDVGEAEDRLAALVVQHQADLITALLYAQDPTIRSTAAEALAQATNSQSLLDALLEALRDPDDRVRQAAANALQPRVWINDPDAVISLDPLIALLDAPTNWERQTVGQMLDALAIDREKRAYIRQHAEARLRELARPSGPIGANFAQRLLNKFTLDDAENIQIDQSQATLLADVIGHFVAAQNLAEAQAEINADPAAPAHVSVTGRPYPSSFESAGDEYLPQLLPQRLRETIRLHTVVPSASGRYRVLAQRTFGDDYSMPPFSGELTWDGARWWIWSADA